MGQEEYIEERMKEFAQNIHEFIIGQKIIDSDGKECTITNKAINSIEVFIKKKRIEGIDSKNWFDMREFKKRFKTTKTIGYEHAVLIMQR